MLKPTKNEELRDIRPSNITSQIADNKSADQTAWMRRLVCAFVVRKQQSQGMLKPRLHGLLLATRLALLFFLL